MVERFIYAEKVVCSSRISPKKEKEREKERNGEWLGDKSRYGYDGRKKRKKNDVQVYMDFSKMKKKKEKKEEKKKKEEEGKKESMRQKGKKDMEI